MRTSISVALGVMACGSPNGGGGGDLENKIFLTGQANVNTFAVFEDIGDISRGFIAATEAGFVIQDLDEDEPRVVADTVGDQLFRAKLIDVGGEFPLWAVGVGPKGFVATNVDLERGSHGLFQVDINESHSTDIDVMPGPTPRLAVANFELGRIEIMQFNGFQFEENVALRVGLPNVVAIEPLDDKTLLAATEPGTAEEGLLYDINLADGGSTATELGAVGLQPRDIECNPARECGVTAFGSNSVTPVFAGGGQRDLGIRVINEFGSGPVFVFDFVEPSTFALSTEMDDAYALEFDPSGPSFTIKGSLAKPVDAIGVRGVAGVPGEPDLALINVQMRDIGLTSIVKAEDFF